MHRIRLLVYCDRCWPKTRLQLNTRNVRFLGLKAIELGRVSRRRLTSEMSGL